ncbi:MAG: ATP-dependent zinc metalloprotease FtsH [Actinomycetota bacterium]
MTEHAKPGPGRNRPQRPAPPQPPAWQRWLPLIGLAATLALLFWPASGTPSTELTYTQFVSQVQQGKVATATIDAAGGVTGTLKGGSHYSTQIPTAIQDSGLAEELQASHVDVTGVATGGTTLLGLLGSFLPFLLLIGFYVWISRRAQKQLAGGLGGILGSRAKVYDAEKPSTRFTDVAGYEGAKQEISEVVDFLKQPERYARAGAMGPRGVLMVGPPGTGKTLLARAVAGEAGVPFFAITGSGFVEVFVGVGAARMRDLFDDAKKRAPAIIFIDEIDAIGQRRGGAVVSNDEREQTLNQLLAEMDGFDRTTGVVVLAATNRPEVLDPALLRPGRFDRQVEIGLPNLRERAAILRVHVDGKPLAPDVDLDVVARATPGFSGADLANLVNEAAIFAVRAGRTSITAEDFSAARDRILLGRRDASNALTGEEKQAVAVHEAGHAVVAVLSPHADPVEKVTILPAGRALGVTEQLPEDERHLYPESYLLDSLTVSLGGRAAERIVLGEVSTGAANDLARATQVATRMVREFGMSDRLGPVGFSEETPQYLGAQQVTSRPYAEATQRVIDEEVERLVHEADERAMALLKENREGLESVAALLVERETIDGKDVLAALGRTAANEAPVVIEDRAPTG